MTSTVVRKARAEGYEWTGITSRHSGDRDSILGRADELKVMGNKVKILLDRSETEFRHQKSVHTYYVVMVKYSDEYRAFQKREREATELRRRELALKRMANECTLEEIQFMLKFKVDSIVARDMAAIAGTDNPDGEVSGE